MNAYMKRLISLTLGVSALPVYTDVGAQQLDEIVVTATRRSERLQDVPVAVSAVTGETLSKVGAKELADYYMYVPSVSMGNNMIGERSGQNIIIRGISNSRTILTADASMISATTGFYINDIPITPVDTQLFDVGRVEVLRGPQGTLYGAGSMGGAVKLYHNRVNLDEFEAAVEGTVSTIDRGGPGGDLSGMVNIPIFEGVLGARIVGSYRTRDGFVDTVRIPLSNAVPNTTYPWNSGVQLNPSDSSKKLWRDSNSAETKGMRAALLYTPTDNLSVELAYLWQDTHSDDLTLYNTRYSVPLQEKFLREPTSSEVTLTSLDISYDFGPVILTSLTGLYTRDYDETIDYTFITKGTRIPSFNYIPAPTVLATLAEWKTVTQEIRLSSNHEDSGNSILSRLKWVVGAFWYEEDRDNWQMVDGVGWSAAAPNNPSPFPNDVFQASETNVKDSSEAYFADLTFDITEKFVVGAGIRYFDMSSDVHSESIPGTAATPAVPVVGDRTYQEDGHTPKYFAQYSANDNLMFFGSYAEGFRLGGSTAPINFQAVPQCLPIVVDNGLLPYAQGQFFSDSVETTEFGVKFSSSNRRVTVNASAYKTDWADLQQQIRLTGFPGSLCSAVLTANVGSAKIDGYELEVSALITDRLSVVGTMSYTDARIVDPGPGSALAKRGDSFQNVPDWAASLMVDYERPVSAFGGSTYFVHGDVRYMGEMSPLVGRPANPLLLLPEYTMVGLRTGFTFGEESPTTVTLFINNVFDEYAHLNARGRVGVAADVIVTPSIPRTIGLTVRKEF